MILVTMFVNVDLPMYHVCVMTCFNRLMLTLQCVLVCAHWHIVVEVLFLLLLK